jgi:hypothetical protein
VPEHVEISAKSRVPEFRLPELVEGSAPEKWPLLEREIASSDVLPEANIVGELILRQAQDDRLFGEVSPQRRMPFSGVISLGQEEQNRPSGSHCHPPPFGVESCHGFHIAVPFLP